MEGLADNGNSPGLKSPKQCRCSRWNVATIVAIGCSGMLWYWIVGVPLVDASMGTAKCAVPKLGRRGKDLICWNSSVKITTWSQMMDIIEYMQRLVRRNSTVHSFRMLILTFGLLKKRSDRMNITNGIIIHRFRCHSNGTPRNDTFQQSLQQTKHSLTI